MRLYRDRAVVLRQHKLGEADRIVTLLTRDHGPQPLRLLGRATLRAHGAFAPVVILAHCSAPNTM